MTTQSQHSELSDGAESNLKVRLGSWHDIARSGLFKFVALGVSAVLGIIITRIIITNFGTEVFAQYGLLVGIGALLPVGILGVDAPIVNGVATSNDPKSDAKLQRILLSSIRLLTLAGFILLAIVLALTALGLWDAILGDSLIPGSGAVAVTLCLGIWALAMPFGIGQKVLAGLGKNHITIAISGLQSPVVLGVLLAALWFGADERVGSFTPVVAYAATFLIAVLATVVAGRLIAPSLWNVARQVPKLKSHRGGKIFDQAWPMVVIMIALPVGVQTDRIVLSHVATSADLAQYNLASQMFTPIAALVSAAGFTLWPRFAAARKRGVDESPVTLSVGFGVIAAGLAAGVSVLSGWLAAFASGGLISLSAPLLLAFAAWMTIQAFQYPYGMYLTDRTGLRFQALFVTLMVPFNVGSSWVLAGQVGAVGPVVGSAVSVLLFQVTANVVFVRHRAGKTAKPVSQ